jgi:hypothetical protein
MDFDMARLVHYITLKEVVATDTSKPQGVLSTRPTSPIRILCTAPRFSVSGLVRATMAGHSPVNKFVSLAFGSR